MLNCALIMIYGIFFFQTQNFEPIWGLKKDYNRSERFFEEKEKLSRRKSAIQNDSYRAVKQFTMEDELEPLSKKVKIELKDLRQKELRNRNKESCDTTANLVPSNNKSPEINVLKQGGKQIFIPEEGKSKQLKSAKGFLSSTVVTESPIGKIFNCPFKTLFNTIIFNKYFYFSNNSLLLVSK